MLTDEAIQRLSARVGTTLRGKYRLERVLGWGGMAAVYAATHRNGTRVAVKLLHPELAVVEHVCRRFLREGVVANAIDHPALVRILDDDIDDNGVAFLVLELLEGETLEQRRARSGGRLSPSECLPIVDVVLDALGAAHDKGFVHRDIKPENVFLTNGGATKLMDFGVVRALDGSGATRSGMLMGTPAFMPPEQASARHAEVDARSDVWAVGALLFTLLSGQEVHRAATPPAQLVFAATKPARPLATIAGNVPEALAHIVDVALAFEPRMRWQSARAMQTAIRASADAVRVTPTPASPRAPQDTVRLSAPAVRTMIGTVKPSADDDDEPAFELTKPKR